MSKSVPSCQQQPQKGMKACHTSGDWSVGFSTSLSILKPVKNENVKDLMIHWDIYDIHCDVYTYLMLWCRGGITKLATR